MRPKAIEMKQAKKKTALIPTLLLLSLFSLNLFAHTLPISYLTLLPDGNYLHLELTLNPFELGSLAGFDANKNQEFDSAKTQGADKMLSEQILQHLKIKSGGQLLTAETAGLSGESGSHHIILRAHFRVPNPQAVITVESDLTGITSASHLTEVTFGREGHSQLARLDFQTTKAVFGEETRKARTAVPAPSRQASLFYFFMMVLGAVPVICLLLEFLTAMLKHLRKQLVRH